VRLTDYVPIPSLNKERENMVDGSDKDKYGMEKTARSAKPGTKSHTRHSDLLT
jgi:hypothetical protein